MPRNKPQTPPPAIELTIYVDAAQAAEASARAEVIDRAWFAQHRGTKRRLRTTIPGELGGPGWWATGSLTQVTRGIGDDKKLALAWRIVNPDFYKPDGPTDDPNTYRGYEAEALAEFFAE